MKHIVLVFIFFTFSCGGQKHLISNEENISNSIVYILPPKVDSLLLLAMSKKVDDISFALYKESDSVYSIYLSKYTLDNPFVTRSNRVVFIDGKFYPLSLDIDMELATTAKPSEVLIEFQKEQHLSVKKRTTIHEGFFVKFNRSQEVLSHGFGLQN